MTAGPGRDVTGPRSPAIPCRFRTWMLPWLPCCPPSAEAPPARSTPRWATLSFPSSLVCQAQAPFHLLQCGPRGCRDTVQSCWVASRSGLITKVSGGRGRLCRGELGRRQPTPGLGSSLVAFAWLRPAGGQHFWGRPHREQELWVLALVGRHPGGLSPSLGTVPQWLAGTGWQGQFSHAGILQGHC